MRLLIHKSVIALVFMGLGAIQTSQAQTKYSLESCRGLALNNNAKVTNGRLEVEASRSVQQATRLNAFPKVSATLLGFQSAQSLIKGSIPQTNLPVYDGNVASLPNASQYAYIPTIELPNLNRVGILSALAIQPIYSGGRIKTGNKLVDLGVNVSEGKLSIAQKEVLLRTEEQYWQIAGLDEKLKTIQAYETLLSNLEKQVDDSFKAGLITRNEVLKVKLQKSQTQMNKVKLVNGRSLALLQLSQTIGIPLDSSIQLTDSVTTTLDPATLFIDPQVALQSRTEYQLLQKSIEAEVLQTKLKQGEYRPQVAIGLTGFYYNALNSGTTNGLAFGSISIPINWWEAKHTLKERSNREQMARNTLKENAELLQLQIRKAWIDLSEAYQQIKLSEQAIAQASENVKLNQDSYRQGTINLSDLLEAQAQLQQTNDQLSEARTSYLIKLTTYQQVAGK